MTRNILAAGIVALTLSSCSTISHTAQSVPVDTQVYNNTVADLNVAHKRDSVTVNWNWNPLSTVSLKAQKESATHALLAKSDADILVEPQYIVKRRGFLRGGSVTVTGYPANYANFRNMTTDDAEKIATINGANDIVVVNPVIATTAGKVVKKQQPTTLGGKKQAKATGCSFINLVGGPLVDINNDIDVGTSFGLMYGSYKKSWGWYAKLTLNQTLLRHGNDDKDEEHKWTPTAIIGAIKTLGSDFSAFAGLGCGAYYYTYESYYHEDIDSRKYTVPIEAGFMKRFGGFNVMLGATYSIPFGDRGSGTLVPFAGFGICF